MDILWRSLLTTCEYDGYTELYETDARRPQNAMALLNGCRKWDKLSWNVKVSIDDHHIFNFLTHFMTVFVFILDDLCCHCHMCVLWARLAIKSKRKTSRWPVIWMIFTNAPITYAKLPSSHYRRCFFLPLILLLNVSQVCCELENYNV